MSQPEIRIRAARPDDATWIPALAPRLHDFGPPPWRDRAVMDAAVAAQQVDALTNPAPGSAVFVAEDAAGAPLGFVTLRRDRDYFTGELVGHVIDIVVARDGEGRGVGRALLAAAERWGEAEGFPYLTLHVFEGNDRARRLYERTGYVVEWTRMLKPLRGQREGRPWHD